MRIKGRNVKQQTQQRVVECKFMELQLIQLYLWVCSVYDIHPLLKYLRLSNNWQPIFTDQELITIYLFGHFQGHFTQKRIYSYTSQHYLVCNLFSLIVADRKKHSSIYNG